MHTSNAIPVMLPLVLLGMVTGADMSIEKPSPLSSPPTNPKINECFACDSLMESVFQEVHRDFTRQAALKKATYTRDEVQGGQAKVAGQDVQTVGQQINLKLNILDTLDRMLSHSWGTWHAYSPAFQKLTKQHLKGMGMALQRSYNGVQVHTARPRIYKMKKEVCGKDCHAGLGPRATQFESSDCGHCISVMRDVAIGWSKLRTRDHKAAWALQDTICTDSEFRHSAAVRDDVQSSCEQIMDEHGKKLTKLLSASMMQSLPHEGHAFQQLAGHLSRALCVKAADMCSAEELKEQVTRLGFLAQSWFNQEPQTSAHDEL